MRTARKKPTSGSASCPSLGVLRRQAEGVEEEFGDDDAYSESTDDAIAAATSLFQELTAEEHAYLDDLRSWAEAAASRPDSKAVELLRWLEATIKPGGAWSDERVIIFTEYRDTQKWLMNLLTAHGFGGADRLLTLYGGMDPEDRERIKAAFQASPDESQVRILLATDAASEGIDLQNHCSRLVHYEIPWNPNRMEQRNGRIDRHGQRAKAVLVYHFVGQGYDAQASGMNRQPGRSRWRPGIPHARGPESGDHPRRPGQGRPGDRVAGGAGDAREAPDSRYRAAERDAGGIRAMLRVERALRERIERLHDQLQTSKRELHLSPENVEQVVAIGLQLAGQPALIPANVPGLWPDPTGKRTHSPAFYLPALSGSWAPCSDGLRHPHTGVIRPIVFDHDLADGRDDIVLAHLGHRLVQLCMRLLRAEVWAFGSASRMHRVTARQVPDHILDTPAVFAHARLVALGSDGQRLHEQILTAGGRLRDVRFARLNVGEVQNALAWATSDPVPEALRDQLAKAWPQHAEALQSALQARQQDRMAGLTRFLQDRATKEMRDSEDDPDGTAHEHPCRAARPEDPAARTLHDLRAGSASAEY